MIVSQFLAQNPVVKPPFVGKVSMLVQVTSVEPSITGGIRVEGVILDDAGTGVSGRTAFTYVDHDELARHFSPDGKQWLDITWYEGKLLIKLPW